MIWTILLFLFLLYSCDRNVADTDFAYLYVDLRIASVAYGDTSQTARLARQNILKEYGWTPEQFEKHVQNLRSDPERWNLFQAKVVDRLDSLRAQHSFPIKRP